MHDIFLKLLGEISYLAKEICLKVNLKGLPSSWDMKVTTIRDHRDLRTLSTVKLLSDLKAYEFEMKTQNDEEKEEKNSALVVEQPSILSMSSDKFNDLLTY